MTLAGQARKNKMAGCALGLLILGAAACPRDAEMSLAASALEKGVVVLQTRGQTIRVEAEVVRTPEARARGLMNRKSLAPYAGMLFVFDVEEPQSFWMKNTFLSLDIIFIDAQYNVVGIVANAEPLSTVSRRVEAPSRYVLEVNGGFAQKHGITEGTRVTFEQIALP